MSVPLLEIRQLTKRYGHVQALRGVDLSVDAGSIVGLIGDNGAGKTTVVKILSGIEQPDGGQVLIEGMEVKLTSPVAARAHGLETVYQDLALAPHLDASANLYLGRERYQPGVRGRYLRWLDRAGMRRNAAAAFAQLGVEIPDLNAPVSAFSGGQRQGIAVARAAIWAKRLLILDEPTAALGVIQTRAVLDLICRIRDHGIAVVLISHNMPDVLSVSDRVTVLRLGRRAGEFDARDVHPDQLVAAMTGSAELASHERGEHRRGPADCAQSTTKPGSEGWGR